MYRVELQQFEGPMDLLLFFIKRDEIDIYDIPIARITDEYLSYVRVLEEIDLDGVGDFLYMAALLINIKAQMLLPSEEEDEGEAVDPRRELVERLLEYVRFKEAADQLRTERERRREHFTRGDASSVRENIVDDHEASIDASVYDLVEALGQLLATAEEDEAEPVHEVDPIQHSVEDQQRYVLEQIREGSEVSFRTLVKGRSKGFVIATFLALLELARQHYIRLHLSEHAAQEGDFEVRRRTGASDLTDGLAPGSSSVASENGDTTRSSSEE